MYTQLTVVLLCLYLMYTQLTVVLLCLYLMHTQVQDAIEFIKEIEAKLDIPIRPQPLHNH